MCYVEEASFYHSRNYGCLTRFSNEKNPLTQDYVKSGLIVLFILIIGATAFPLFQVMAPDLDSESSLEGDLSFTVYPDGDFGMKIMGTFEDSYEEYQVISPIREMLLDFQIVPIETNLHKGSGSCVLK